MHLYAEGPIEALDAALATHSLIDKDFTTASTTINLHIKHLYRFNIGLIGDLMSLHTSLLLLKSRITTHNTKGRPGENLLLEIENSICELQRSWDELSRYFHGLEIPEPGEQAK